MPDKFNTECLDKHNEFRAKHSSPALRFAPDLATSAQKWADHLARQGRLEHSPDSAGKLGENVAMKWVEGGTEFTGQQATCQWYSEIKDFHFGKENQTNCGHFSQVVWKASQEAGFGRAQDAKSGKVFVVGQYRPAGNFMNKWNDNIPRPVSGRIEVPSEEDIMGPQTTRQSNNNLKGDLGGRSSGDVLISKQTKSKTSGGKKTVTVVETYQKADGSKYTLTKETTEDVGKGH